jgi:hypothetical protein
METIQQEYQQLYVAVLPTEASVPTYTTYDIDNKTPEDWRLFKISRE